ncbi:hypothetical protein JAO74_06270 [Sphingomonas sp. BT553]|uniref:GntR family transcriptional regulator n=2 Tax=Sphingomonas mollis TaxID=2795726 RepID=A0ABS0XMX9_9SPHN|nr:hypothetical protein [Sphingomonas sp. BT553]
MAENSETIPVPTHHGFASILADDVIRAYASLDQQKDAPNRRNVIRSVFVAIEGLVWTCREHVRDTAASLDELTPLANLALREMTYTVTEQGLLLEQVRFITLPAMLRLVTRQAQSLATELSVDFGGPGWAALKTAMAIRNRVTHPKSLDDLTVTIHDLSTVRTSFQWIASTTTYIMEMMNARLLQHNTDMAEIMKRLDAGDPVACALINTHCDRTKSRARISNSD